MAKQPVDIVVGVSGAQQAWDAMEKLAMKARQLRREDALSGENALGRFLNRGIGGVAQLGMSAAGFGAVGLVADFATRTTANLTQSIIDIRSGKETLTNAFTEFAKGIPIIGGLVQTFSNLFEIATGLDKATARMNAIYDANEHRRQERTSRYQAASQFAKDVNGESQALFDANTYDQNAARRRAIEATIGKRITELEAARTNLFRSHQGSTDNDSEYLAREKELTASLENAISARTIALGALEEKEAKERRERHRQLLEEVRADEQEALQASLQGIGLKLEAELALIRINANKRREEANRVAQEQYVTDEVTFRNFLQRRVSAINEIERQETLNAQRNDYLRRTSSDRSVGNTLSSTISELLSRSGQGLDAQRLRIAMGADNDIYQLAAQISDPSTTMQQKRALGEAISNIFARRNFDLANMGGVPFNNRAATGTSTADRFSTGVSDALLMRTAQVDTSKNTERMWKEQVETNKKIQKLIDSNPNGGQQLTVRILSAVGNN